MKFDRAGLEAQVIDWALTGTPLFLKRCECAPSCAFLWCGPEKAENVSHNLGFYTHGNSLHISPHDWQPIDPQEAIALLKDARPDEAE